MFSSVARTNFLVYDFLGEHVMESQLRRLVEALPGSVWTALPDGNLDFVNQCWRGYTGLELEDALGSGWQVAVHPMDLPSLHAVWRSMLASGEAAEIEARLRRRDGQYRWFQIAANPVRDETRQLVRWCGLNTDIDE